MKRKKLISEKSETDEELHNESTFYRLIFIGDTEVGKTQIINRYNNKLYQEEYFPTYSVDFQIKSVNNDRKLINIHCIDTQGSSDFSQDTGTLFIQNSNAFIYVFDISSRESFYNLNNYYEIIKLAITDSEKMIAEKLVYLVGNKCDLVINRRISEAEGRLEATKYNAKYIEVSAKTGMNIDKLFNCIIKDLNEREKNGNSIDQGGGIINKNIIQNNNIVNDKNNIINDINYININNNINMNNINNNIKENKDFNINTNTHTNMIENEKNGLNYDSSTYYLKSNMSINNNNNFLKSINNNNFEMNNEKKEFKNTNFFSNYFSNKCQIF